MRIETITKEIYKFNELTQEQKKLALGNLRYLNVDYGWWKCVYDDAAQIGLRIKSFDNGRAQEIDAEFTQSPTEVAQDIFNNHGPMCETYKVAQAFMEAWEMVEEDPDLEDQLVDLESEFLTDISECYLAMLGKEYVFLTTDKAVIDTIAANDYEFTVDGKLV